MERPQARDRNNRLRISVTSDERQRIADTAASCGLSVAALCRELALGHQPKSKVDLKALRELSEATLL